MRDIIVSAFRSAVVSAVARATTLGVKETVLVVLSTTGALTGIGLCTLGVYELTMTASAFAYRHVFAWMVALGLFVAYAFNVGTSGMMYSNGEMRVCMLVLAVGGVLLCEFWLVLSVPMDAAVIDQDFERTWRQMFDSNRGGLQWVEHRFGCRGFRNATDMPSSSGGGYHGGGCLPLMRRAAMDQNMAAMWWCVAAAVGQIAVLALGALIYARDQILNNSWIIDELGEEEDQTEAPPTTPIRAAPSATAAEPSEQRHIGAAERSGTTSGGAVVEAILLPAEGPSVPESSANLNEPPKSAKSDDA
ncbi:hypothetical protein GGI23_000696 [Coemansia sp. RSA 2559]|nr:hypothetical protein GGI23_000696 [Coemansia sp. RSA 2559]